MAEHKFITVGYKDLKIIVNNPNYPQRAKDNARCLLEIDEFLISLGVTVVQESDTKTNHL